MTGLWIIRAVACRGVRECGERKIGPDYNRRGQDKSDGPVGVYAVVVVWFFEPFYLRFGAARGAYPTILLDFLDTMPIQASC